ncbi:MAG TPA: hypothetical protein DD827_11115 [Gammaproteobacteria bacterium]|nr:hypothetical protein [Gammaproteobacteria bacterium]
MTQPLVADEHSPVTTALTQGNYDAATELAIKQPDLPLARLISHARKLKLAQQPMWMALLHYQKKGKGWESQIDVPHYFLSEQGKTNPQRELEATLAGFFSKTVIKPMRLTASCRFVARRQWLTESLGDLGSLIPNPDCPEFKRYKTFFAADTLTVIFPSAHPNSPSSAFGHTLLRLDKKDQDSELKLLNQSLNFAAEIPEQVSPLLYAVGGITGAFQGRFHILPYHIKLREYGQVDNRDIWEYTLNLSPKQVDWVLTHAYEMLIASFDYYFFRENCSYHLLSLLDVAFPEDRLTDAFQAWVIPVDTIKILEQKQLIRARHFEGSLSNKIKVQQRALTANQVDRVVHGKDLGLPKLSPVKQAMLLDLASDFSRYQRLNSGGSVTRLSKAERRLLKKRAKIPLVTEDVEVQRPKYSPDQGHGTSRIGVMYSENQGVAQYQLQFRPAYHDFLDPSTGYGDNTAIDFGSVTLASNEHGDVFLKEFVVLDIQSVEPRDRFFKPVSWRTRIAFNKGRQDKATRFELLGGAGLAYRASKYEPLGFVFAETSLIRDRDLDEKTTITGKLRSGVLWEPLSGIRLKTGLKFERDFLNSEEIWTAEIKASISLAKNWALTLGLEASGLELDHLETDPELGIRFYF